MKKALSALAISLGFLAAHSMAMESCTTDTTQAHFQAGVPNNVVFPPGGDVELAPDSAIDQVNESVSGSGGTFHHFWWYAQSFTAGVSGPLTAVEVRLFCNACTGTPPAVRVSIRAMADGKPTAVDLASTTIPGFTSAAGGWYRAEFTNPVEMSSGTQYAIVVGSTAPWSTGQYAYLYSSAVSTYPGGFRFTSTTAGNSWIQQNYDTGFRVFTGNGYVQSGDLVSSIKDSNPEGGIPAWSTLSWNETLAANTDIEFQAAASNSIAGPFDFVGPDGTPGTTYSTSGADLGQFDGFRYLRYRALLSSSESSNTPVLHDVTVCHDVEDNPDVVLKLGFE